jgi:NAD(P)-dependent dehydrogenase (short-subunit alcohol dehydrogenase family)
MGLFDNKVGIVTGAASGIGRASAIAYAKEGAAVVLADVESTRTYSEEVVDHIRKAGGEATFVATDVSDVAAVRTPSHKMIPVILEESSAFAASSQD